MRYHEELYTSKALGEPGSWLARPHRLLADALAHLPCRGPVIAYDLGAVRSLLNRIEAALRPGGVAAIAIVADRFEVTEDGRRRPALLESEISSRDADRLLREVFGGYDVIKTERKPTEVAETRDGERYALRSTLVSRLAVKPRGSEGS
ncbi:hypothetical protein GCM10017576_30980 [Microbacterium barkeri]|uniref:Uncharacterized protein n=1 Tax=Microbacterium barkeri TaxID=33917 RepID=A0A9W6LXZ3_9MICO|nr:hypothetical protein [Microbacterium barkeri]MDR6878046.1 hypothetical protein [Microbacterium barkeri]GLJ62967.1 hypothetical protein GCM10017576_30980 [Microbacterium barkeri]